MGPGVALVLVEEPTSLNRNDVTAGVPMYPFRWMLTGSRLYTFQSNGKADKAAPASLP